MQQATELAQLYTLNMCTPDILQTIINRVEAEGSFSGMLRLLTARLMHSGYVIPNCKAACDWHQHMSAAEAGTLYTLYSCSALLLSCAGPCTRGSSSRFSACNVVMVCCSHPFLWMCLLQYPA